MSETAASDPEQDTSPPLENVRSMASSRKSLVKNDHDPSDKLSNVATPLPPNNGIRSPLPVLESQLLEPLQSDTSPTRGGDASVGRSMAMSPLQGRLSPERLDRSSSPTKGLGGFVQSAMLKRSDSVSKRWSAQQDPGLSRGNSIASNRSGYDSSRQPKPSLSPPRELQLDDVNRKDPSKPGSHPSTVTTSKPFRAYERPEASKPAGNLHEKQAPIANADPITLGQIDRSPPPIDQIRAPNANINGNPVMMSPPSSPSKKWSPTKSSWLENAINKPESPKPKVALPQQPAWMANLSQTKQQRSNGEASRSNNFREVTTGGLLRSPPMGVPARPTNFVSQAQRSGDAKLPIQSSKPDGERPTGTVASDSSIDAITGATSFSELPPGSSRSPTISPIHVRGQESGFTGESVSADSGSQLSGVPKQEAPPPLNKPKPETPPKRDFRANLKTRQVSSSKKDSEDLEFKNVFGKLKRTQTQNYVAPDQLKDNILRGKAGLTTTTGPKKSERRDEFKDSILKSKDAMKTGGTSALARKPSAGDAAKDGSQSLPEALAKQKGLIKSDIRLSNASGSVDRATGLSKNLDEPQQSQDKPKPLPPESASAAPAALQSRSAVSSRLGDSFSSSLTNVLSRGPPPSPVKPKPEFQNVQTPTSYNSTNPKTEVSDEPSASTQLTHMTKSRAKGPKRRLPKSKQDVSEKPSPKTLEPAQPVDLVGEEKDQRILSPAGKTQIGPLADISHNNRKTSQPPPPRKPSTNINHSKTLDQTSPKSHDMRTQPAPLRSTVSPNAGNRRSPSLKVEKRQSYTLSSKRSSQTPPKPSLERKASPMLSNKLDSSKQQSQASNPTEDKDFSSVNGATASSGQTQPSSVPTRITSPIKVSTYEDQEVPMEKIRTTDDRVKPGNSNVDNQSPQKVQILSMREDEPSTPSAKSPRSPPLPGRKPQGLADRVVSNTLPSKNKPKPSQPPASQTSEAAQIFAELFEDVSHSAIKVDIDTEAIIASRMTHNDPGKMKTLRKQIWEVSGGGKLLPVPSHQEHILFEDSMYICTHVFGGLTGARTSEVYLWCGDGISTSAIEDAQLFARKIAKDYNGKLSILKQGKESASFFQALGGIVILRRGASDRPPSSYIICGRRHMGQIAFDEVDFSPHSLCGGFPMIVCTGSGSGGNGKKVYLWKGRGSTVDELGCARLISMDLGPTGDVEEVDEGREPESFWSSCFPGGKRPMTSTLSSSDSTTASSLSPQWHLKATREKYTTRLYQVDVEPPRPKSSSGFKWVRRGSALANNEEGTPWTARIKEIAPFAQSDVWDDGIFVLDVFFE
ncbi:MAG: hypothetical protein Q9190_000323, partial [Brigantiaea leucoxantha]